MKTFPELKDLLIIGYLRGGYRSAAYTVGGLVIAAWAILVYAPHFGWIAGALALVALVWSVLMVDMGQKVLRREMALTSLPLTGIAQYDETPERVA